MKQPKSPEICYVTRELSTNFSLSMLIGIGDDDENAVKYREKRAE